MLPVAILAGGLATRLRPVTKRIPKALVEINGEPFLAHQLRLLAASGIGRATLCVGYLAGMVEAYAGDGSRFGVELTYSADGPEPRGTAGPGGRRRAGPAVVGRQLLRTLRRFLLTLRLWGRRAGLSGER